MSKIRPVKLNTTKIRHQRVRDYINKRYNEQRIRFDDIILEVETNFGYSESYTRKYILKATA